MEHRIGIYVAHKSGDRCTGTNLHSPVSPIGHCLEFVEMVNINRQLRLRDAVRTDSSVENERSRVLTSYRLNRGRSKANICERSDSLSLCSPGENFKPGEKSKPIVLFYFCRTVCGRREKVICQKKIRFVCAVD